MNKNEFKCELCGGIFKFVRNEEWSEEKAEEEYEKTFPNDSKENRHIVCDDCYQIVKPKL